MQKCLNHIEKNSGDKLSNAIESENDKQQKKVSFNFSESRKATACTTIDFSNQCDLSSSDSAFEKFLLNSQENTMIQKRKKTKKSKNQLLQKREIIKMKN